MNGRDAPLLVKPPRPASEQSDEDRTAEEDALLTGQNTGKRGSVSQHTSQFVTRKWQEWALFVWAFAATAVVVVLAVLWQHGSGNPANGGDGDGGSGIPSGKRNLIFMVSDGMGPTSLALTRSWRQFTEALPWDETLVLDKHLIGQSRTRSSSSLVTDSAAGATAFSCGQKSYNGAISVLPDFSPCGSVMEAAKRLGYTTGLVVTTRITDATPAVFASHVRRREMEDEIAMQMIGATHPLGRVVDLMFGGGREHFLPNTTEGSSRKDDVDVREQAKGLGWSYIDSRKEFDNLGTSVELPMLGLFADGDFPYEIDRVYEEKTYPSLAEMSRTALDALSAATEGQDQGFFIMIEGSRIDHAGHANDPAAQTREVLAYDKAMGTVLDFIKDSKTPTLMVSTSDHETGGLAVARQLHEVYPDYLWYPGVLANASHSASYSSMKFHQHLGPNDEAPGSEDEERTFLSKLLDESLGVVDATDDEMDLLLHHKEKHKHVAYLFADMVSRRAQTGWSTHGHSGADVNIYASDAAMASDLVGNHENTDVGAFLRKFLGAEDEVKAVTKALKQHVKAAGDESWLGSVPEGTERLDGQDHLEHYTGDHKKRAEHLEEHFGHGECELCAAGR
ncbi:Alkaline phosphatase-like protein [Teratosphaeria destructans]|uniref:Alkaline phosphatase n=1 Tax=Teratosphaeria destructans TaxID=418781 RepID=A0A9W7W2N4_9PEZI|nr:Alkaline phosphatase-like protein [Teratosphaeria destructans]